MKTRTITNEVGAKQHEMEVTFVVRAISSGPQKEEARIVWAEEVKGILLDRMLLQRSSLFVVAEVDVQ